MATVIVLEVADDGFNGSSAAHLGVVAGQRVFRRYGEV
jgi:hypothetical protein